MPEAVDERLRRGAMALFKRGKREAALAAFQTRLRFCAQRGSGVSRAHRDLGVALLQCGKLAEARRELKAAAQLQRMTPSGIEACLANDIQAIDAILREQKAATVNAQPAAKHAAAPRSALTRRHTAAAVQQQQQQQPAPARRSVAEARRSTVASAGTAPPTASRAPPSSPPPSPPPPAPRAQNSVQRVELKGTGLGRAAEVDAIKGRLLAAAYTIHGVDIAALFARYDVDSSGELDLAELGARLQKLLPGVLSEEQLQCLLDSMYHDSDGRVDLGEFFFFVNSRHGAGGVAAGSPAQRSPSSPRYQQTTAASRRRSIVSASPCSPSLLSQQPRQQQETWEETPVTLANGTGARKAKAAKAAETAKAAKAVGAAARAADTVSMLTLTRAESNGAASQSAQQHVKRPAWQLGFAAAVRAGDLRAADAMAEAGRQQEEQLREEKRVLEQQLEQQRQQLASQTLQLQQLQEEQRKREQHDTEENSKSAGGVRDKDSDADSDADGESAVQLTEQQRALVTLTLQGLPMGAPTAAAAAQTTPATVATPATPAAAVTPVPAVTMAATAMPAAAATPPQHLANGASSHSSSAALATEALGWLGAGHFSPVPAAKQTHAAVRTIPMPVPQLPVVEAERLVGQVTGTAATQPLEVAPSLSDFDRWAATQEAAMAAALDGWAHATAKAAVRTIRML